MKTHLLLSFCFAGIVHAQVYTPPAPDKRAPAAAEPAESSPGAEKKSSAASMLGQEIPLLDPAAESITVAGVTIPLGDNRIIKARFEKYLSQPPESGPAAGEYRFRIDNILKTISPFRSPSPDLYAAFKQLPAASAYPGDANLCMTLAESIYMAMLAKGDVKSLQKLNLSIEDEKKKIILESDWEKDHEQTSKLNIPSSPSAKSKGGKESDASPVPGVQSLKYADSIRRIAEIELLKKSNIAHTEVQTVQTKAQYQVSMIQWFAQRRYEHVLMAARFYNQIWKDGDSTLRIEKGSDVSKMFSQSVGVSPTVTSLDALANEFIRETTKYIEAFDLMLSRNELHSASQRLLEAYAIGEYLAPVATLSLDKKRRIADYVRDLYELYGALQVHDCVKAKELAVRLKSTAKDFPSSKVDSAISAYTLSSDLAIEEAKALLLAKEIDKAGKKFQIAFELWPTNPKLQEFRTLVNNGSGLMSLRNDFDRLLSEGNFREIAKRQYEIAPSIQGDLKRETAFKEIVLNLMKIETALGKAKEFSKMEQNYAAWEQLAKLREDFPDDPKLGRELELLAPKVADFTRALDKAAQFEKRNPKQIGSALSWYLKARSIHPQSDLAEAGSKRLVNEILPPDESTAVIDPPKN